jgi:hypothetical protein
MVSSVTVAHYCRKKEEKEEKEEPEPQDEREELEAPAEPSPGEWREATTPEGVPYYYGRARARGRWIEALPSPFPFIR